MYKQVIVVNKGLNMSPGKLGAMVAHGSVSYFCEWLKGNVSDHRTEDNERVIKMGSTIDNDIFSNWVNGDFTKIVLEVQNEEEMKEIVKKAQSFGFKNKKDFFNIVDDSTEFLDIPKWAVVAFRPMEADTIDLITGDLNLYTETRLRIHVGDVYKVQQFKVPYLAIGKEEFLIMLVADKWLNNGTTVGYRWLNLTRASLLRGTFSSKEQAEDWLHRMCGCLKMEKLDVDEIHI